MDENKKGYLDDDLKLNHNNENSEEEIYNEIRKYVKQLKEDESKQNIIEQDLSDLEVEESKNEDLPSSIEIDDYSKKEETTIEDNIHPDVPEIDEEVEQNIPTPLPQVETAVVNNNKSNVTIIGTIIAIIVIVLAGFLLFNNVTIKRSDTDKIADLINNSDNNKSTNVSSNWKEYKVNIDDNSISLPILYSNLESITKWKTKKDYESTISIGKYGSLNLYEDDKMALSIKIKNNGDSDLKYNECSIIRITQTKYQTDLGVKKITFPGNLQTGMSLSKSQLIDVLGTPSKNDSYSNGKYVSETYMYMEDQNSEKSNYYLIKIVKVDF